MEASGDGATSPKLEDFGGNKFKFLCSYGGQILPRPGDGNLRYVGGETRIVAVGKNAIFQDIMNKLENLCGTRMVLKYQLPVEDLDLLVSVTSDEDLQNMKEEYERYESFSCKESCPLLRIFLFPSKQILADHSAENQTLEQKYIDAVNGIVMPSKHKFPDYSLSVDPNRPTEMDVDSSAPSTARTNSGSFQADHTHHLVQALQEVDLNRHLTDQFSCKCKSNPKDQIRVSTQSKPMIQIDKVISNPTSPTGAETCSPTFDLHRVQSSPNLQQHYQGFPASTYSPSKHVPARPAIVYRGRGGGELPSSSRLRYSRSDAHINRPPYLVAQESPRNVVNHNHMTRNTSFQESQNPNHKLMNRNTNFQDPQSPNHKLISRNASFQDSQSPNHNHMTSNTSFQDSQSPNHKLLTRNTSFQDPQSTRKLC